MLTPVGRTFFPLKTRLFWEHRFRANFRAFWSVCPKRHRQPNRCNGHACSTPPARTPRKQGGFRISSDGQWTAPQIPFMREWVSPQKSLTRRLSSAESDDAKSAYPSTSSIAPHRISASIATIPASDRTPDSLLVLNILNNSGTYLLESPPWISRQSIANALST